MHQTLFIIEAFLQRNHGLGSTDALYVIDFKNDVFCMGRILGPDFTEDVELSSGYMRYGNIRYLVQTLQNEFRLVCLFKKNTTYAIKA